MYLLDQPPLGSNAVEIADQQHAQHQFWINGWAASVAIQLGQIVPNGIEIQQTVDLAQQMGLGNMILDPRSSILDPRSETGKTGCPVPPTVPSSPNPPATWHD